MVQKGDRMLLKADNSNNIFRAQSYLQLAYGAVLLTQLLLYPRACRGAGKQGEISKYGYPQFV